jgi:uncharacterized protein DUF4129
MLSLRRTGLALLLGIFLLPVMAAGISISEYRQQLSDIAAKVNALDAAPGNAADLLTSLPATVTVSTGTSEITVNYQHLKDDLATFSTSDSAKRGALLAQLKKYVGLLSSEADAYESAGDELNDNRQKLGEILHRREFRNVHGPSAQDALVAKIYRWLARMLGKLHGPGQGTYKFFQGLVWVLIGGAMLVLMLWTVRRLTREGEETPTREIIPFAPSARNWRSWLSEAREFAARQDWRNAIHLAYWAGISFLESSGAWKPNRARTPREYLRLLTSRNAKFPPLSRLTRKFEVVWYGNRAAAEADFRETLAQLEELGCR